MEHVEKCENEDEEKSRNGEYVTREGQKRDKKMEDHRMTNRRQKKLSKKDRRIIC